MKRKITLVFSAILLIIISGLGYYYGYFVKTPNHTLQIVVRAVKDKDVDTFNRHVDVKSIVGFWIDDAMANDPKLKNNPMASAFMPIIKPLAQEAIQTQVNEKIAHPDKDVNDNGTKEVNQSLDNLSSNITNIQDNHKDLKITDLKTTKLSNGDSKVTLNLENTKTSATAEYSLYMHPLSDGTWQIYKADPLNILLKLDKE